MHTYIPHLQSVVVSAHVCVHAIFFQHWLDLRKQIHIVYMNVCKLVTSPVKACIRDVY